MIEDLTHVVVPEGLALSDIRRLASYAVRITEHAALAFAKLHSQIDGPSVEREFYLHGLDICRRLTPAAVNSYGYTVGNSLLGRVSAADRREFSAALKCNYSFNDPIPHKLMQRASARRQVALWTACSDICEFVKTFTTRTIDEDDARSVLHCVQSSLNENNLVEIYNALDVVALADGDHMPGGVEFWTRPQGYDPFGFLKPAGAEPNI